MTGRDGERAQVIGQAGFPRRDEVGQAVVFAGSLVVLLAQKMELGQALGSRVVGEQFHIVADAVRREKTVRALGREQFFADDAVEQFLRVVEQLLSLVADGCVVENFRVTPLQLPRVEERRPVDVLNQRLQREVVLRADAGELRLRDVLRAPVDLSRERARLGNRQQGLGFAFAVMLFAEFVLQLCVRRDEIVTAVFAQ